MAVNDTPETMKNCKDCKHLERGLWVRFTKKHHERKCLRSLESDFAPAMLVERVLLTSGCGPEARFFENKNKNKNKGVKKSEKN